MKSALRFLLLIPILGVGLFSIGLGVIGTLFVLGSNDGTYHLAALWMLLPMMLGMGVILIGTHFVKRSSANQKDKP